jgi:predicted nucleotidyltransferase
MSDIFIDEKSLEKIRLIIRQTYPDAVVWAYGSRVGGNAHESSDLDLVVKDFGQEYYDITELKEAFKESNIPFLIDISEFDSQPLSFQKEIERKYAVVYGSSV